MKQGLYLSSLQIYKTYSLWGAKQKIQKRDSDPAEKQNNMKKQFPNCFENENKNGKIMSNFLTFP
jgi:hypothetical protein